MEFLNRLIQHPFFQEEMNKIDKLEEERIFCKHGWQHSLDVARSMVLLNLERKLGYEKEFLYILALIHDIGRGEQYIHGTPHEVAGAEIAEEILSQCGLSKEQIKVIKEAILCHRTHAPEGSLGALLIEADKKTRLCFQCKARKQCNWPEERKNLELVL